MTNDVQDTDTLLSAHVAEEIRALLARRKMSGRELARRLGVSPNWVSLRTSGEQEIGLNDLQRIASILGVSVSDLLPRDPNAITRQKFRPALGERVVATVGEARAPRSHVRKHRPGRPVSQTRPIGPLTRPATAVTAGR